jgi:hypothetical protein
MTLSIDVSKFQFSCLTRKRGSDAFAVVREQLGSGTVELSLLGVEFVSLSFLDEFVSQMMRNGRCTQLIIRSNDVAVEDMVSRIAGTRNLTLWIASESCSPRQVSPAGFEQLRPVLTADLGDDSEDATPSNPKRMTSE